MKETPHHSLFLSCLSDCSHHDQSEVVSVRAAAVVCALNLQFVALHSADLDLVDEPADK